MVTYVVLCQPWPKKPERSYLIDSVGNETEAVIWADEFRDDLVMEVVDA